MNLPIYFISDNHFYMKDTPDEAERRRKLYALFSKIQSTGGTLIIGGDFFDFWFDYKKFIPNEYSDLFDALENLHISGIDIHYIAGNHDYWDNGYFNRKFSARFYKDDFQFQLEKLNILVTHGDGILISDGGYRVLKLILRSKINIFLFNLLGAKIGCRLAKLVSATTRHYDNQDNRNPKIITELTHWAETKWTEGIDVILVGHYHQIGIEENSGKKLIFMGDWVTQFTVTVYDGKDWHQYSWNT